MANSQVTAELKNCNI